MFQKRLEKAVVYVVYYEGIIQFLRACSKTWGNDMKKKPKKRKSIFLRVFALGVCAYMMVTLIGLWKELANKKAELERYTIEHFEIENSVEELRALLSAEDDTPIIEKAARERLGYVYSNEQVFIDISGS